MATAGPSRKKRTPPHQAEASPAGDRSAIHRRVERRMAVHQIDALESCVKFLQRSPAVVEALFRDSTARVDDAGGSA